MCGDGERSPIPKSLAGSHGDCSTECIGAPPRQARCLCQGSHALPHPHDLLCRLAALLDGGGDWPSTSLIRNVLGASSTDHVEESALNLLIPEERVTFGMGVSYWSSKGSDSAGSVDWVALRLAHPLCLLREVRLRPFKAWFQPGAPIYAPQFVRFRVGGAMLFDPGNWQLGPAWLPPAPPDPPRADDPGGWDVGGVTWESPLFPVDPDSAADQLFELPQPVLCVGGLLVIELIGKVKQQLQDNLFYGRWGCGWVWCDQGPGLQEWHPSEWRAGPRAAGSAPSPGLDGLVWGAHPPHAPAHPRIPSLPPPFHSLPVVCARQGPTDRGVCGRPRPQPAGGGGAAR